MSIISNVKQMFGLKTSSGCAFGKRETGTAATAFSPAASAPAKGGNWFNGIGKKNAARRPVTVYSRSGAPLKLKASDILTCGGEGTIYNMPGKDNILKY